MLHPDFTEHVRPEMLDRVLGGLISGIWSRESVNLLYLGWRHEVSLQVVGERVASHVHVRCALRSDADRLGSCDGSEAYPLEMQEYPGEYNPVLLDNLWRWSFGRSFHTRHDNFGGYDFSQLLVS